MAAKYSWSTPMTDEVESCLDTSKGDAEAQEGQQTQDGVGHMQNDAYPGYDFESREKSNFSDSEDEMTTLKCDRPKDTESSTGSCLEVDCRDSLPYLPDAEDTDSAQGFHQDRNSAVPEDQAESQLVSTTERPPSARSEVFSDSDSDDSSGSNFSDEEEVDVSLSESSPERTKMPLRSWDKQPDKTNSSQDWTEKGLEFIDFLISEPLSMPFRKPVDVKEYPSYPTVVERPIDLTKIREELVKNQYRHGLDLVDDIRLMIQNARRFNEEKSEIAKLTNKFSTIFEAGVNSFLSDCKVQLESVKPKLESVKPKLEKSLKRSREFRGTKSSSSSYKFMKHERHESSDTDEEGNEGDSSVPRKSTRETTKSSKNSEYYFY